MRASAAKTNPNNKATQVPSVASGLSPAASGSYILLVGSEDSSESETRGPSAQAERRASRRRSRREDGRRGRCEGPIPLFPPARLCAALSDHPLPTAPATERDMTLTERARMDAAASRPKMKRIQTPATSLAKEHRFHNGFLPP